MYVIRPVLSERKVCEVTYVTDSQTDKWKYHTNDAFGYDMYWSTIV